MSFISCKTPATLTGGKRALGYPLSSRSLLSFRPCLPTYTLLLNPTITNRSQVIEHVLCAFRISHILTCFCLLVCSQDGSHYVSLAVQ